MAQLFELIDINSNGSISKKEFMVFLAVMSKSAENEKEKGVLRAFAMMVDEIASKNDIGDGEITKAMWDAYEPDGEPPEGFEEFLEYVSGAKDQIRANEKEAMEEARNMSDDEMGDFVKEA